MNKKMIISAIALSVVLSIPVFAEDSTPAFTTMELSDGKLIIDDFSIDAPDESLWTFESESGPDSEIMRTWVSNKGDRIAIITRDPGFNLNDPLEKSLAEMTLGKAIENSFGGEDCTWSSSDEAVLNNGEKCVITSLIQKDLSNYSALSFLTPNKMVDILLYKTPDTDSDSLVVKDFSAMLDTITIGDSTSVNGVAEDVGNLAPYDLDLTDGHYIGGLGIPTGNYTITLVSGSGNVYSHSAGLNEIFGEGKTTIYNNFNFSSGTDFAISGALTIHIHSDSADFGAIKQREIHNEEEKILYPGKYGAGYDFPSGTYFICGYEGSGNVYSLGADVNEVISVTPEENHSIYQYNYATFEDGDTIEVSSCTVKLVPAGS